MTSPQAHQQDRNRLPATGAGFVWDVSSRTPVLRAATTHAVNAWTTRIGGTSTGDHASLNLSFVVGDDEANVGKNRAIAGATIDRDGTWSVVKQVHGAEMVDANDGIEPADGHVSSDPSRTLAVLSADCVLLLFAAPERVAVAHAGWRGMVGGMVESALAAVPGAEIFAGPAIGPCCFEVGPEVIEAFAARYPSAVADERHIDLWAAAEAAVGDRPFHAARICTSCHADLFFSHRRDKGKTGRQALIARLAP